MLPHRPSDRIPRPVLSPPKSESDRHWYARFHDQIIYALSRINARVDARPMPRHHRFGAWESVPEIYGQTASDGTKKKV
ncbi:MAG: hypothetical protein KGM99_13645 [Burkholderiales bacterium]|nr:hypothetical protein [Burkholderiales bacterium]